MNIFEKLTEVQNKLIAPKDKENAYGGFNYRCAEDILKAVKPLLKAQGLTQVMNDDVECTGDRFYIKSTITLINVEKVDETIKVSAYARNRIRNLKWMMHR